MTPRARISVVVSLAALGAAGATVGATVITSGGGAGRAAPTTASPQPGAPPLILDLGLRTDPEARALRRASRLYASGRRLAARAIFERYGSLEAAVGAALASWPEGIDRLDQLVRAHPDSSLAQLEFGLSSYWQGHVPDAEAAWKRAGMAEPDTSYAVRASDFLHPAYVPGLPFFVPSFGPTAEIAHLSPRRQLAALAARARAGAARDKILYGVALQRLGRPISAERQFAAAAVLAPTDPEARVAAAVALFDKDRPGRAFSKLGPLTRMFPRAATVRFHLGLMLIWLRQVREAKVQFRRVLADAPSSPLAPDARRFLQQLGRARKS